MTKEYYLKHAQEYINETRNAKIDYMVFEKYLMPGSHILDLGSGSGRDCFHFGFNHRVSALDYIPLFVEEVKYRCEKAMLMDMRDFEEFNVYDGIWAHDSLIHLSSNEIIDILNACYYALHGTGVMYCSFIYGEYQGMIVDRYLNYMNEEKFELIINETNFKLVETKIIFENVNNNKTKNIIFILSK